MMAPGAAAGPVDCATTAAAGVSWFLNTGPRPTRGTVGIPRGACRFIERTAAGVTPRVAKIGCTAGRATGWKSACWATGIGLAKGATLCDRCIAVAGMTVAALWLM